MTEHQVPYNRMGVQPGDIITFNDLSEVIKFEDDVAAAVDPSMTQAEQDAWTGRKSLRDLLTIPKFNGKFLDIGLTVMENPYNRLIDIRSSGFSIIGGSGRRKRETDLNIPTIASYTGFTFTATAKSTGRPAIGTVESALWYFPVLLSQSDTTHSIRKYTSSSGGRSVVRLVANPRMEPGKVIEDDETARRIGFELLRTQMMQAQSQPSRT